MRLHLIYVRFHQWLSLAFTLRAHLSTPGDRVRLVVGGELSRALRQSGLANAPQLLPRSKIAEAFADPECSEIFLYLQFSLPGRDEYLRFFDAPVRSSAKKTTLALYPDGYTNNVYGEDAFAALFAERPFLRRGPAHFLDAEPQREDTPPPAAVVSSRHMMGFVESAFATRVAQREFERLAPSLPHQNVLALLLRPWGSAAFLKGRLSFEGGADIFADIIHATIDRIMQDIGRPTSLLLRADNRDPILADAILVALRQRHPGLSFAVVCDDWPGWLTFEPFLYHFAQRFPGKRLHVAGFDSTASLPFLTLASGMTHYFGVPSASTAPIQGSEGLRQITHKLRSLRQFVARLPGQDRQVTDFDELFFKVVT